jgi:hypothetical protein
LIRYPLAYPAPLLLLLRSCSAMTARAARWFPVRFWESPVAALIGLFRTVGYNENMCDFYRSSQLTALPELAFDRLQWQPGKTRGPRASSANLVALVTPVTRASGPMCDMDHREKLIEGIRARAALYGREGYLLVEEEEVACRRSHPDPCGSPSR